VSTVGQLARGVMSFVDFVLYRISRRIGSKIYVSAQLRSTGLSQCSLSVDILSLVEPPSELAVQ
jgi:hypothetical protein